MLTLRAIAEGIIFDAVRNAPTRTRYREPLVGYADAADSRFDLLRTAVDSAHASPFDILPAARTVLAFFVPFAAEVVRANAHPGLVAEEWAVAYEETNQLIQDVCRTLADSLSEFGVRAAWELPTYDFDREKLVARWSHKSVAFIAGLGKFGRHQMLVTPAGCAGRFGSIVLDANLPTGQSGSVPSTLLCDRGCRACITLCPVGALSDTGLDKQKCYAQCLHTDSLYRHRLGGVYDVCGKCATGPCALRG